MMTDESKTITAPWDDPSDRFRPRRRGVAPIFCERGSVIPAVAVERTLRIGRLDDLDIVIRDPRVSRHHANLEPAEGGTWLTDLGSHNGTFVDGKRIGPERTFVDSGSVVRIGSALLLLLDDACEFLSRKAASDSRMIGGPRTMRLRRRLEDLAGSSQPVLLLGETGTGKEVAAHLVHDASGRLGRFVALNCAAVPPELVESELFGHVRGAFSGAQSARTGLFRSAHRGTLLLDEVGDLALSAQAKLLRVLEERTVRPIGGDDSIPVDVRLISATNRSLEEMVAQGKFRLDLYHRLAAVSVAIPPLRDRLEDIPLLAAAVAAPTGIAVSVTAMERLVLAPWPGNVRQLKSFVSVALTDIVRAGRNVLQASDVQLDRCVRAPQGPNPDEAERIRLSTALRMCEGNVAKASRELGVRRGAMYQAFQRLGIDPEAFRRS